MIYSFMIYPFLVKEDATRGIYVDRLTRHIVADLEDATRIYEKGVKSRYSVLYI